MGRKQKAFVDKERQISNKYYEYLDSEDQNNSKKTIKIMKEFIKNDPQFFDPYTILAEELQKNGKINEAVNILNKGFHKAVDLITDEWGKWPDELHWDYLENRHIIRVILNKALSYWIQEQRTLALDLLRKLLHSNHNDNIGARTYMLAILLGWSFDQYESEFMTLGGFGYDGKKMNEFENRLKEFPEEFGWWLKDIEES